MNQSRQMAMTLLSLIAPILVSCGQNRPAIEEEQLIVMRHAGEKGVFYFLAFELATGSQPLAIRDVMIIDPGNDQELRLPEGAKEKIAGSLTVQDFMNSQMVFDDPKMQKDYEAQDFYKEIPRTFTRFASAEIKTIMADYVPLEKFKFSVEKSKPLSVKISIEPIENFIDANTVVKARYVVMSDNTGLEGLKVRILGAHEEQPVEIEKYFSITKVHEVNLQRDGLKFGRELFSEGDYKSAIQALLISEKADSANADIHFYLAQSYEKLENGRLTLDYYKAAYSLDSTNTEMLMAYGSFAHNIRHKNRARILFTKLLQSDEADKYVDAVITRLGYVPYRSEVIPEGSDWMAVSLYESQEVQLVGPGILRGRPKSNYLFVKDNRTGERRELPSPHHANSLNQSVYDSENERIIAAFSENNQVEIYATDLEKLKPQLLSTLSKKDETIIPGQIKISDNGGFIVFAACSYRQPTQDKNSHLDLYSVDVRKGSVEHIVEVLANPLEMQRTNNYQQYNFDRIKYSEQARYFAFALDFTISRDAKKLYYLRPDRTLTTNGNYSKSLWVYDLSSKENRQLANTEFDNPYSLHPSPEGDHLIFLTSGIIKRADGQAIKIFDLKDNAITSFENAKQYSFISRQKMMFGIGDTVFEYDLTKGEKKEIVNQIPDAAQRAIAFAKDGKAIYYSTEGNLLRIPLPPEKISAKEFLAILTAMN